MIEVTSLPDAVSRDRHVAIGTFDGVHVGHRAVIDNADTVLTFEPHPLEVIHPQAAPKLLMPFEIKRDVLDGIAAAFTFPAHFGKNLDALYDCMTDLVHKAGQQPGFVVVLEQIPDNPRFDREAREQLLEVFRDAAEFWGERRIPFRCFYSFQ